MRDDNTIETTAINELSSRRSPVLMYFITIIFTRMVEAVLNCSIARKA
jgi:hypothetical protein